MKLIIIVLICQSVGIIGSLFTRSSIPTWYSTLAKPSFAPPNWIFAPVWTTLYLMMGISAYLILSEGLYNPKVKKAVILFVVQLILNAIWSPLFFGLKSILLGLIVIMILWVFILLTILRFFRMSKIAGLLLIPYLLWTSFATILNFSLFILNP